MYRSVTMNFEVNVTICLIGIYVVTGKMLRDVEKIRVAVAAAAAGADDTSPADGGERVAAV